MKVFKVKDSAGSAAESKKLFVSVPIFKLPIEVILGSIYFFSGNELIQLMCFLCLAQLNLCFLFVLAQNRRKPTNCKVTEIYHKVSLTNPINRTNHQRLTKFVRLF